MGPLASAVPLGRMFHSWRREPNDLRPRLECCRSSEIVSAATRDQPRRQPGRRRAGEGLGHGGDATFAAYRSVAGSLAAAIDAQKALLSARFAQTEAHGVALIAASSPAFLTGRPTSFDALAGRRRDLTEGPLRPSTWRERAAYAGGKADGPCSNQDRMPTMASTLSPVPPTGWTRKDAAGEGMPT